MSRIYEALKNAERSRRKTSPIGGDSLGTMELPESRASQRQVLDIDLTVYGYTADKTPFYEQAKAIDGNHRGGLFLLAVPVTEGQELLLINNQTSQEQICSVVNFTVRDEQTGQVSVAFPASNPEFWQLAEMNQQA